MSTSTNFNLVRSIDARWQRGDFTSGDGADPEIEFAHLTGRAGLARS